MLSTVLQPKAKSFMQLYRYTQEPCRFYAAFFKNINNMKNLAVILYPLQFFEY